VLPGTNPQHHEDKSNIFWVEDLCIAAGRPENIGKGGLQQVKWSAIMARHLAPPGEPDQVLVPDNPSMGLEHLSVG
jgi:hypothetical protein